MSYVAGLRLFDITLPLDCDRADMSYLHGLGVEVLGIRFPSGRVPDVVTDDFPTACTSWNLFGAVADLVVDFGFPGNLLIWADADCCEPAVGVSDDSRGAIKGLYRE